jgi:hypothetical protein
VFFDAGEWDWRTVVMAGSLLVLVPVLAHDFSQRKLRRGSRTLGGFGERRAESCR